MAKATTIRFADEVFARLDQASARTGMPVNSIVVAACLEWMQRHTPEVSASVAFTGLIPTAPRWATLKRALGKAVGPFYPFENFTMPARELLSLANQEADKRGHSYIGTEHLLLACLDDPKFQSARVLSNLAIDRQSVEKALERVLRGNLHQVARRERIVPTSRVKRVIELAFNLAGSTGSRVGTQHLLLALSREGEGIAAHVLGELGATHVRIEAEIRSLPESED
jgi:hypothetical protein